MNFKIYFLFALSVNTIYSQSKIVKFKFEIYPINLINPNSLRTYVYNFNPDDEILASKDILYRLLTDNFYFNLTLGTPPQIIPTIWDMNQYSFKFYRNSFKENISSSFKNISPSFRYNFDESNSAFIGEENFYFIDNNNNSFSNLLNFLKFEEDEKNYSFVGLQLPDYIADNLLTFPRALKLYKIINNYIFFVYYNKFQNNDDITNYNGNIYFGEYPHNIKEFQNEFNQNIFQEIQASARGSSVYWDILFDNIYFGGNNTNLKNDKKQVELLGNMKLTIGIDDYQDFINKNFFDKYLNKSICKLKTILNNTDYQYYECINNTELFDIKKFPTLKFELKELNFNFSFNYKDLFFIYNNKIYFGIIFNKFFKLKYNQRWKFGSAIFRKYLLTFNQDSKKIGIYKKAMRNNDDDYYYIDEKNKNNNKNMKIFIKIIIIIFILILIILIVLFIKKYIMRDSKINDSKTINYTKGSFAYDSKNKNIVHQYYELGNNLVD